MARIISMDSTFTGHIQLTTEDGETLSAPVLVSVDGYTIFNVEVGGGIKALRVIDYGDGDAELDESQEGETFDDGEDMHAYIVRRTGPDSLKWVANVREAE